MSAEAPVVLLTGFEPFGGAATNPSWDAADAVAASWSGPGVVHARRVPVTFADGPRAVLDAVAELRPDAVVMLGLHGGAHELRLERVAVNVADARIPDNAGAQPVDEPVVPGGPVGHWSTLPLRAALDAVREAGVPVALSPSAGTYVCNATFYAVQDALADGEGPRVSGFVHVPPVAGQRVTDDDGVVAGGEPGLPQGDLVRGVAAVVGAVVAALRVDAH
ncbi:pyroglutamyl-peptidase I [Luteimicrobium sp. NPDC057192]|uniref:pyroglutamyl-peptidase I family protein n=1 Tax=Luteimicrobium sp. NPDC057192 TaxID=3346042 RepID=UPI0036358DB7